MSATKTIGAILRELRESKGFLLREVGAKLSLDPTILSKIERGDRMPTREQIRALSDFYKERKKDVMIAWLSDKLVYEVQDEELALEAMKVAEEKVSYRTKAKPKKTETIHAIQDILKNDGRVSAAWLFGSLARGEEKSTSDVDIMVEMNSKSRYSMFDLLDLAHRIEEKINRKVDLVEKGFLKDFAAKTIANDLIKIHG